MNPNLESLKLACEDMNVKFELIEVNPIAAKVKNKFFVHCTTPLNSQDIAKITKDKSLTYTILKDAIKQPKTIQFVDPEVSKENAKFVEFADINSMIKKVEQEFQFPVVVKMNSGERRRNFHICNNCESTADALRDIFNKESKDYDFIALAQEKINYKKEYRVIVLNQKIELIYEKYKFNHVDNEELQMRLQKFIEPIFFTIELNYGGLDIAELEDGNFVLFEINTSPRFAPYRNKNGHDKIVSIYKKILEII